MSLIVSPTALAIAAIERGIVPDRVVRCAIRSLCAERLRDCVTRYRRTNGVPPFLPELRTGPVALVPQRANEQHYELPADFFAAMLGPRRKYSCCLFRNPDDSLARAEDHALEETGRNALLENSQDVLELGCGWGSLSLWMAERFPDSRITAVSNSASQREHITTRAAELGLTNLRVITADMNEFDPSRHAGRSSFDRVVSVEMFEHMRNYELLLQRIASWLQPDGRLFVHVFCHRKYLYPFTAAGESDWMARHFFTGGLMPSADLFGQFDHLFELEHQAIWDGRHYQQTADAWLANLDAQRDTCRTILAATYGRSQARIWLQRWRMFLLAVSELFGYSRGEEWQVTHCRLRPVR